MTILYYNCINDQVKMEWSKYQFYDRHDDIVDNFYASVSISNFEYTCGKVAS